LDHRIRVRIGAAAAVALIAAAPLRAEEPAAAGKTVTEQVLDILREQGTIDDARYEALKKQAEEEQRALEQKAREQAAAEAAAPAPAAATTPDPEGWKIYFKDNFRLERNDGLYKFKFGGRIQYDIAGTSSDQALQDAGFDNQGTGDDFRRARLAFEGEAGEHLLFKAEYDFANGDGDLTDVFVGLQRLPGVGRFVAGHFKESIGLEELTSSKYITFMERALPLLAFAPARNAGIAFNNSAFEERLTWGVGGFRETDDFGEDFSDGSNYNVTARVTGLPVWLEEGRKLVHVGYSYSHKFRDGETITFAPKPEVNTSNALISTGAILNDGVDLFGAELAAVVGPVSIQGEFLDALVDANDAHTKNFYGVYGEASWFVTGENRVYDRKIGAFGRTAPKNPFSISKGQWGALELAGRYSHVHLNDGTIRGGIENDVTAAVNWYLYSNLRVMLDWVYAHRNATGEQNTVMTRFSLDF
jgi:phosphate-selective porin OprO/OprP